MPNLEKRARKRVAAERREARRRAIKRAQGKNFQEFVREKEPKFETYQDRNRVLTALGFTDYAEYLKSELWAKIRTRAFSRHGRFCLICVEKATEVHHLSYLQAVLLGKDLSSLAPICEDCHKEVEFDEGGKKRTLKGSQVKFEEMRTNRVPIEGSVILTRQMIEAGKSDAGGWNRRQLKTIGIQWAEISRGWISRNVGRPVTKEEYAAFLASRG